MRGILIVAGAVIALFVFFGTVIGLGMYRVHSAQREADAQWAAAQEEKAKTVVSVAPGALTASAPKVDARAIIRLTPESATLDGSPIRVANGAIAYWDTPGASARWTLDPPAVGSYRVEFTFAGAGAGRPFLLRVGDSQLTGSTHSTGSWDRYETADMGVISVPRPGTSLKIQSTKEGGGALMNLKLLRLLPTTAEATPAPTPVSIPVVASVPPPGPSNGHIILTATEAQLHGSRIHLDGGDEKHIGSWTVADDWIEWSFPVSRPGRYRIDLTQASTDTSGGEFDVLIHHQIFACRTKSTGDFDRYITLNLGSAGLQQGQATLAIKPRGPFKIALMNVMKVELTPE
ncbi:MAG: putative glycosyl hydrolase [Phycisphaerales bacterium]|nr:putative glycosyl hydrolase [Phycisphaerales bacterium]